MPLPTLPRHFPPPKGAARLPRPPAHVSPPPPAADLFHHEPEVLKLTRREMYRAFLRHLRFIPDPHVWMFMVPRMRELCRHREGLGEVESIGAGTGTGAAAGIGTGNGAGAGATAKFGQAKNSQKPGVGLTESESGKSDRGGTNGVDGRYKLGEDDDLPFGVVSAELERIHTLKRARKELAMLRAAVAVHPHAMERLLERCYGQRGLLRRQLIQRICDTSPPPPPHPQVHLLGSGRPDLPAPLNPTRPSLIPPQPVSPRARSYVPRSHGTRKAILAWKRDWDKVQVPLVLPQWLPLSEPSPMTGWEGAGVVESLRIITGDAYADIDSQDGANADANADADNSDVDFGAGGKAKAKAHASDRPVDSNWRPPLDNRPLPDPRTLPTWLNLPPHWQRLFPRNLLPSMRGLAQYQRPRLRETRANPSTWRGPRVYRPQLVRRIYRRMWDSLVWVKPVMPAASVPTPGVAASAVSAASTPAIVSGSASKSGESSAGSSGAAAKGKEQEKQQGKVKEKGKEKGKEQGTVTGTGTEKEKEKGTEKRKETGTQEETGTRWVRCSFAEMVAFERGAEVEAVPAMLGLKKRRNRAFGLKTPIERARFQGVTPDEAAWIRDAHRLREELDAAAAAAKRGKRR